MTHFIVFFRIPASVLGVVSVSKGLIPNNANTISTYDAGIYSTGGYEILGLPQYAAIAILNRDSKSYQKIAIAVSNHDKAGTSSGKGFYVYDSNNAIFKKVFSW